MEQQKAMRYLKSATKGAAVSVIAGTVILFFLSWLILLGISVASMFANGILFVNGSYVKMMVSIFAGSMTGGMLGTRRKSSKKRKKTMV